MAASESQHAFPVLDLRSGWDFGDPVASEKGLRAASRTATATDVDILQTQIARALGLQERYDETGAVLAAIVSQDDEVQVRIALERGRLRRSCGEPAAAAPFFERATDAAEAAALDALAVGCVAHAEARSQRAAAPGAASPVPSRA